MTPIRSFVSAPEPLSDLRGEALLGAVAGELAACLRRFVDVRADDGTLARAERALAVWDLLVGAAEECPGDGARCPGRDAVPVAGTDRDAGVTAIVA